MTPELARKFAESVARENALRDGAFYDPLTSICGVKIRQMNLLDFQALDGLDNPLIHRVGIPTWSQVVFFLWLLAPTSCGAFWFSLRCRRKLKGKWSQAVKEIWDYMDTQFLDSMSGDGKHVGPSYYSSCAFWVDRMGAEYGWTREYTMKVPLRILFQLSRRISQRNDPDCRLFNPLSSRVRAEDLRQKTEALKARSN